MTTGRGYGPAACGVRRQVGGAHQASWSSRSRDAATATWSCRTCSGSARTRPGAAARTRQDTAENGESAPVEPLVGQRAATPDRTGSGRRGPCQAERSLASSHARLTNLVVSANILLRCRAGGVGARVAQTLNRDRGVRKSFFQLLRSAPEINAVQRSPDGRGFLPGPRIPGSPLLSTKWRNGPSEPAKPAPSPPHGPPMIQLSERQSESWNSARSIPALSVCRTALTSGHHRLRCLKPPIGFEK